VDRAGERRHAGLAGEDRARRLVDQRRIPAQAAERVGDRPAVAREEAHDAQRVETHQPPDAQPEVLAAGERRAPLQQPRGIAVPQPAVRIVEQARPDAHRRNDFDRVQPGLAERGRQPGEHRGRDLAPATGRTEDLQGPVGMGVAQGEACVGPGRREGRRRRRLGGPRAPLRAF
jgi:hypothetical protein